MKGIKWWLWIVGLFYLMEGGGLSLFWLADPEGAAAIWAPTSPPGSLDAVAVEALSFPALFVNHAWLVLGFMMLYFTRAPARAGMLMTVVIALELFAWVPLDLMALASGWSVPRGLTLLAIHVTIAATGIFLLRSNKGVVPV
jgi:hypothetical protein